MQINDVAKNLLLNKTPCLACRFYYENNCYKVDIGQVMPSDFYLCYGGIEECQFFDIGEIT